MRPKASISPASVLHVLLLLAVITGGAEFDTDEELLEDVCRERMGAAVGAAAGAAGGAPSVCGGGTLYAVAGRTATLACTLLNPGPYTVSWVRSRDLQIVSHAGVAFTADTRVSAAVRVRDGRGTQQHLLTIAAVRPADGGRYECQVNTEPKISAHFDLVVEESAPRVEVRVWQLQLQGGVTLVCRGTAARDATLTLSWARDGHGSGEQTAVPLGATRDTRQWGGGAESRLVLPAAPPQLAAAAGLYRCSAALAHRADDAALYTQAAALTVHIDHQTEAGPGAEGMQSDQWAASTAASAAAHAAHMSQRTLVLLTVALPVLLPS